MASTSNGDLLGGRTKHLRASAACGPCRKLKAKCDLSVAGSPCSKCRTRKIETECQKQASKRGKYIRHQTPRLLGTTDLEGVELTTTDQHPIVTSSGSVDLHLSPGPSRSDWGDRALNAPRERSPDLAAMDLLASSAATLPNLSVANEHSGVDNEAEQTAAGLILSGQEQPEPTADVPASAWVDLMSLSSQDHWNAPNDASDYTYVSDLFTVSHILRQAWKAQEGSESIPQDQVHFPKNATTAISGQSLTLEHLQFLNQTGSFTLPARDVLDALITSYFQHFHPIYPVISKALFYQKYEHVFVGGVSLLLLWSMAYIGAQHCPIHTLESAGFTGRLAALKSFYNRGHALYSFGYEKDKVTIVQAEFLFSSLWSGSEDSYQWAGRASTQAVALGMHRSTAKSNMLEKDRRLWRRIFWSVYIRDRHSAAATGRPYRIFDHFNDVEMAEDRDFDEGEDAEVFIASVRLAALVGAVVECRLRVNHEDSNPAERRAQCHAQMLLWKESLSKRVASATVSTDIVCTFLHLSYHCWMIHLFRPQPGSSDRSPIASESAAAATRIFEDLLEQGCILQVPQFGVTCLFAAMAQHVLDRQSSNSNSRKLSGHRLAICMMVAKELSTARPVAVWFERMFKSLLPPDQADKSDEVHTASSMRDDGSESASRGGNGPGSGALRSDPAISSLWSPDFLSQMIGSSTGSSFPPNGPALFDFFSTDFLNEPTPRATQNEYELSTTGWNI